MEFEKKYYTKAKELMDEVDEELQRLQSSMTEEEKLAEKEQNEQGFQKLLERCENELEKTRRIFDPKKRACFEDMVAAGKVLAEAIEADISVKSDEMHGTIRLETGLVLFGIPCGYAGRDELMLLMRMADDVFVIPENDTIKWEFSFDFFDTYVG